MRLSSQPTIISISLALSVLFSKALGEKDPENRILIGYRLASPEEAELINTHNRPVQTEFFNHPLNFPNDIGPGYYLVSEPAALEATSGEWYCVVKADKYDMAAVKKVWIPEDNDEFVWSDDEDDLWTGNEAYIDQYLRNVGADRETVIRFSPTDDAAVNDAVLQMVIPTDMVNENKLGFWAQCWPTDEEQDEHTEETLHWKGWNIDRDPRSTD
ncbi:uncharacterized protein L3040_008757 [Drepanopeziza brunnea f. sp. 'multigermtubi']|uniref:Uncharacterized protein n=1 Tax=Marssonina brunnea f. sp. multigermtubi (strain MB_m1) TaxID=1072389 RepID=K1X157_MARBU|nr:uncharacterized protein MBM_02979 [Drepanopeziza brunnea f. sp. 'multigermtubi' MB_m1]EKD18737.1 hypothetical protein MBM_02979 [Drepanopeziza brunnea f. sp. 'multigermtubi' MB_m1]KAJ5033645.1 hypothetical protein L3040_008757 [Drepanopeziza brunnea f. sp. 'multigermtubi']